MYMSYEAGDGGSSPVPHLGQLERKGHHRKVNEHSDAADHRGFQESHGKMPARAAQPPQLLNVKKDDFTGQFGLAMGPGPERIGDFHDFRTLKPGDIIQEKLVSLSDAVA